MPVTASKKNDNRLDSLEGYDSELRYVWGPWIRKNGGSDPGLGFSRTNILHHSHGFGFAGDVDMPSDVKKVDKVINSMLPVVRQVAIEWYVYNQCVSKSAMCKVMSEWYAHQGVRKSVTRYQIDAWIGMAVVGVWTGLGMEPVD